MPALVRPNLFLLLLVCAGVACSLAPPAAEEATPTREASTMVAETSVLVDTPPPAHASPAATSAGMAQAVAGDAADDGPHPRLFFRASAIARLREQAASSHQEIWAAISGYADSQVGAQVQAAAPSSGSLDTYRNAGNELIAFAFACVISEEARYCDLARSYLLTYAGWEQWGEGGERDLGLAHMLLGNALAYDWLYSRLGPDEQQQVRMSLGEWAQRMYEASSEPKDPEWNNWWSKSYIQNHYWTNNAALGLAGLALLDEDPRAQTWIDHAAERLERLRSLLDGIGDGSWHESIAYQSYGLTLLLPFLVNLRTIQERDLLPHTYLQNYTAWRVYNHIPASDQYILAFGNFEWDWGNGYQPQNVLRFVAREYQDGIAEWMARELIAANGRNTSVYSAPWYVFEFFYYDPAIQPQPPDGLARARVFPDAEAVIWRTGWGSDDLVFGLKTGAYGGRFAFETFTRSELPWETPCSETGCEFNIGHNHDDSNGFYLHRAGAWLAPESEGVDRYATSLHNTLLIDDQGQYRPPEQNYGRYPDDVAGSDGFLEATASSPHYDYLAADATRRYKQIEGIDDITRHVLFVRPGYFVMLDSIVAESPHRYEWVSHFGQGVSVEEGWVRGEAANGQVLAVGVVAPQPFEAQTGDDGKPYVRIRPPEPATALRFIQVLYPTSTDGWASRPSVEVLADDGTAAALRIGLASDGRSDDVIITYGQQTDQVLAGPYTYDGRVASVSRNADGRLERLFVGGGSYLHDDSLGLVLVEHLKKTAFEAIYDGSQVSVYGEGEGEIRLYAPEATELLLNGEPRPFRREGDYILF